MILFLIVLAIEGLVIGALARLALPGRDPMSIWQTMLIGIVSVFISGLIVYVLTGGARGAGFFASFVVAFIIVYLIRRRRGGDLTHPGGRRR
jgi:uncharacterized membrane protein YeaQ/YmgE (transglycosylase-associated protein family)